MTLGLCAMSLEIGMPVGRYRLSMDALAVQRLAGTKPSPLATSIKIGLHGFEQAVQDEGGWVIVRPLAMDILMIIAINWRRFWREWIRVGDMGGDPIGMMHGAMVHALAVALALIPDVRTEGRSYDVVDRAIGWQ